MEDMGGADNRPTRHKSSSSSSGGGDTSRQRLRPWLEARIESNSIPGLYWLNREHKVFRVSWKRGGKQDWSPQDSQIFEEWAKYTGRYREGIDQPDYATWKTRLRCAFNKAPDIEELKELSNLLCADPYRVYRLKPRRDNSPKQRQPGSKPAGACSYPGSPAEGAEVCADNNVANNTPVVPIVVDKLNSTSHSGGSLGSDLKQIPSDELFFQGQAGATAPLNMPADQLGDEPMDFTGYHIPPEGASVHKTEMKASSAEAPLIDENVRSHELFLQTHYLKLPVAEVHSTNPKGCRLSYGKQVRITDAATREKLYGPDELQEVIFPYDENFFKDEKQRSCTQQLLEHMDRGLQLESNEHGIFAVRRCMCVVFYASAITNGEAYKISRGQRIQLFNMQHFLASMQKYLAGEGPKPQINIQLGFGQKWPYNHDTNDLLISVNVLSRLAFHFLNQAEQLKKSRELDSRIDLSTETSLDNLAKRLRDMAIRTN